jgi:TRAP-type transport system large permease protein
MLLVITVVFFGLILLGMPIGFTLGIAAFAGFLMMGNLEMLALIPQRFFSGMDLFPLMAIPFFILAGEIMNKSLITLRLVKFSNPLIGHLRGGLGHVNIMASIFMAGVSGSAVADTSALGSMLIPAMEKEGYPRKYSAAITAASSIIGPIIPPSIIMVVYGSLTGVSIAGLFAGGIIPGVGMGILLMAMNHIISKRRNFPKREKRASLKEMIAGFRQAALALVAPIIIVGGILGGIFTPTESAAVAVGYCFFVGFFVFRTLKLKDIPPLLFATARTTGITFVIVAFAASLAWILTSEQVPQIIATQLFQISHNKYVILIIINIFLLIVGMFMDVIAALIILGPVLAPVVQALGIHPIHFGVIMSINLCMALVTPPVGACLFVACSISRVSMEDITMELLPFILFAGILLAIVTFIPAVTLTIPRLFGLG